MKKYFILYAMLVSFMAITFASCESNNNTSGGGEIIYGTSTTSSLLKSFSLKANEKVLANLDSVHFTIDQDKDLIYNVDSLPMGTDVSRLLVNLEFGSTVGKAKFVVSDGKVIKDEKTIEYTTTSTDSIDFTGTVHLNVTAADGVSQKNFKVMVNVHQTNPDSIEFAMNDRRNLPASADENYAVGMAQLDGTFYSMVNNSNGRYVATASTPAGKWAETKVSLPFNPVEKTLTATTDALYVLDDGGNLYTSTNAVDWTATGVTWTSILGAYGNQLLGMTMQDGKPMSDEYPRRSGFVPAAMPEGFPVSGHSQLIVTDNDWVVNKLALMVGGRDADGKLSNCTWGYDGNSWAQINSEVKNYLPAIEGATLFSFYTYDVNKIGYTATKKITWVVMGGRLANGTFNRSTYVSRNQGITWTLAATSMQLPSYIPSFSGALAFVCTETMSAEKARKRVSKPITEWDCSYVYLVGGQDTNGQLLNNVWKGTVVRMTYKPVY